MKLPTNEWIPMYKNERYMVNWITGEVKGIAYNAAARLKPRYIRYKNGKVKKATITLRFNGVQRTMSVAKIVAEAVLQKNLDNIPIAHKNGMNQDNSFLNLAINQHKQPKQGKRIEEYKRGEFNRIYESIREFEAKTGVGHMTFKRHNYNYSFGQYQWIVVEE